MVGAMVGIMVGCYWCATFREGYINTGSSEFDDAVPQYLDIITHMGSLSSANL